MNYLFTSESVTSGHPDKLCDFISDSILDACISKDSDARVAVEVFVKGLDSYHKNGPKSFIIIGGEVSMKSDIVIDFEKIARDCAIEIGYTDINFGMNAQKGGECEVLLLISQQSSEISQGINKKKEDQGAGDQGIIFGFASNESENFEETNGTYMPLPILLSQKITLEISKNRKIGNLDWSGPDGKSQVTIAYDEFGKPQYIDTIVVAIQHKDMIGEEFPNEGAEREFVKQEINEKIIKKIIPKELINEKMNLIVNGTGRFCIGGPQADTGLTGRKIIVDTYGGSGRHGGGAFSGKDPSKVDRSAAYYARWVAKHIVASELADKCEIQIAYSIGISKPVSLNFNVETFGTSEISNNEIKKIVENIFDFRPYSIISTLKLRSPIYSKTSSGGHFGRKNDGKYFTWENIDDEIISELRKNISSFN